MHFAAAHKGGIGGGTEAPVFTAFTNNCPSGEPTATTLRVTQASTGVTPSACQANCGDTQGCVAWCGGVARCTRSNNGSNICACVMLRLFKCCIAIPISAGKLSRV